MPITGYQVFVRQADLQYKEDRTLCDGSDFTVITNSECTVQMSQLQAEPFNL